MSAPSEPSLAAATAATEDGLRVAIRLTPKARRDAVEGLAATADGGAEIRVSVTAVPEDGKANRALVKLLAKVWEVPKTAIELISGHTDRHKILLISADPRFLLPRIEKTLAS